MPRQLFWLAVIAIGLAYWLAVTKEIPVIANAFTQFWYTVTLRNAQGNFANYPVQK